MIPPVSGHSLVARDKLLKSLGFPSVTFSTLGTGTLVGLLLSVGAYRDETSTTQTNRRWPGGG